MRPLPAVLLCVALTACGSGGSKKPAAIDGVEVFANLKHTHVTEKVNYEQSPPVGGPHSPVWLRCGVYPDPIPNENGVHSMEHGAVWITYKRDLAPADVLTLARLAATNPSWVLVSPYDGLPSAIVATAWGLQLKVDSVGDKRLAAFVQRYAGGTQGGEKGVRCDNGATLDQIHRLKFGTPSPTPPASPK